MRNRRPPQWFAEAVFYEIYPQTFFDTNGDGIGDIPGMIEKLDYIESLGVNGIWINPCFASPFYDAGYDVSDYYRVAPRYGTNDDLRLFVEAAHGRGIRVLLDLVPGHTSVDHPWFQQSAQVEPNELSDRYIWTDSVWEHTFDIPLEAVRGYSARNGKYMANFFYTQPALNYGFAEPDPARPWQKPVDHPAVRRLRRELMDIMRFWLDTGVDGFRVDMAYSLVKNDPGRRKTTELWHEIRDHLDREYPDAVLVAEWHEPVEALRAYFDACFLLPFDAPVLGAFRDARNRWSVDYSHAYFHPTGRGTLAPLLAELGTTITDEVPGYPALAAGNHDVMRVNVGRSVDDLELIHAFTLFMPGVPFIYYGDEIGMEDSTGIPSVEGGYERTSARTPMQWTKGRNAGFSRAAEDTLYTVPVRWDPERTVEAQDGVEDSLLNRVRRLIRLVRSERAFNADAAFDVLSAEPNEYPFVFMRSSASARFLVVMNPSGREAEAMIPTAGRDIDLAQSRRIHGSAGVSVHQSGGRSTVTASARSYAVFTIDGA